MKLWDLRNKKSVYTLKPHSKPVTSVDISIDGKVIASGSGDTVKIWEGGRNAL